MKLGINLLTMILNKGNFGSVNKNTNKVSILPKVPYKTNLTKYLAPNNTTYKIPPNSTHIENEFKHNDNLKILAYKNAFHPESMKFLNSKVSGQVKDNHYNYSLKDSSFKNFSTFAAAPFKKSFLEKDHFSFSFNNGFKTSYKDSHNSLADNLSKEISKTSNPFSWKDIVKNSSINTGAQFALSSAMKLSEPINSLNKNSVVDPSQEKDDSKGYIVKNPVLHQDKTDFPSDYNSALLTLKTTFENYNDTLAVNYYFYLLQITDIFKIKTIIDKSIDYELKDWKCIKTFSLTNYTKDGEEKYYSAIYKKLNTANIAPSDLAHDGHVVLVHSYAQNLNRDYLYSDKAPNYISSREDTIIRWEKDAMHFKAIAEEATKEAYEIALKDNCSLTFTGFGLGALYAENSYFSNLISNGDHEDQLRSNVVTFNIPESFKTAFKQKAKALYGHDYDFNIINYLTYHHKSIYNDCEGPVIRLLKDDKVQLNREQLLNLDGLVELHSFTNKDEDEFKKHSLNDEEVDDNLFNKVKIDRFSRDEQVVYKKILYKYKFKFAPDSSINENNLLKKILFSDPSPHDLNELKILLRNHKIDFSEHIWKLILSDVMERGDALSLKLLIHYGADQIFQNKEFLQAVLCNVASGYKYSSGMYKTSEEDYYEIINVLISMGACVNKESMYEHLFSKNRLIEKPCSDEVSAPILAALQNGCTRIAQKLVEHFDADIKQLTFKKVFCEDEFLAREQKTKVALFLKQYGLPLEGFDSNTSNILHMFINEYAYIKCDSELQPIVDIVKDIFEKLPASTLKQYMLQHYKGKNILHHALSSNNDIIKLVLLKAKELGIERELLTDKCTGYYSKFGQYNKGECYNQTPLEFFNHIGYELQLESNYRGHSYGEIGAFINRKEFLGEKECYAAKFILESAEKSMQEDFGIESAEKSAQEELERETAGDIYKDLLCI